jgi:hypothetical protein
VLTQDVILKNVNDFDLMKDEFKYDFSDQILSVDSLVIKTEHKFKDLLKEMEQGRLTDEMLKELDEIAERNKHSIGQLK